MRATGVIVGSRGCLRGPRAFNPGLFCSSYHSQYPPTWGHDFSLSQNCSLADPHMSDRQRLSQSNQRAASGFGPPHPGTRPETRRVASFFPTLVFCPFSRLCLPYGSAASRSSSLWSSWPPRSLPPHRSISHPGAEKLSSPRSMLVGASRMTDRCEQTPLLWSGSFADHLKPFSERDTTRRSGRQD